MNPQAQEQVYTKERQKWFSVNRSVSVGEILVALATVVVAFFNLEKRVSMMERDVKFQYDVYNETKNDMKEVKESLNEIKLILKDKQDKKDVGQPTGRPIF